MFCDVKGVREIFFPPRTKRIIGISYSSSILETGKSVVGVRLCSPIFSNLYPPRVEHGSNVLFGKWR